MLYSRGRLVDNALYVNSVNKAIFFLWPVCPLTFTPSSQTEQTSEKSCALRGTLASTDRPTSTLHTNREFSLPSTPYLGLHRTRPQSSASRSVGAARPGAAALEGCKCMLLRKRRSRSASASVGPTSSKQLSSSAPKTSCGPSVHLPQRRGAAGAAGGLRPRVHVCGASHPALAC